MAWELAPSLRDLLAPRARADSVQEGPQSKQVPE